MNKDQSAVLVNGQFADQISVFDRGFAYGDGLFETIACIQGQPRLWSLHFERLVRGLARLAIKPASDGSSPATELSLSKLNQASITA